MDEFLISAIPDLKTVVFVTPLSLAYAWLTMLLLIWLRTSRNVGTPGTRKVFHVLGFTTAAALQVAFGFAAVVVFSLVLGAWAGVTLFWRRNLPFYEALSRESDGRHRMTLVIIPIVSTATGGALANLLFAQFAVIGYLVVGWGDAAGEVFGRRWGRLRYRIPLPFGPTSTRTLEGSIAVAVVGALAAASGMLMIGSGLATAIGLGVACGIVGAVAEAAGTHGTDNFTMQVAASAIPFVAGIV